MTGLVVLLAIGWAAPGDVSSDAIRFLELCHREKFAEAVRRFDAKMTEVMPPDTLKTTWNSVIGQAGPLKEVAFGPPRTEKAGAYTRVLVRCEFARMPLDAIVVFDAQARIAGLFFVPIKPARDAKPASYVDPKAFDEQEVDVGAEGWPLKGAYSRPKSPASAPLVVMVQGSGPHDRDETIGPNAPFRDVAGGLASRGIAVLRYEKRTLAYGTKLKADPPDNFTIDDEVIADALAAIAKGRMLPGVDAKRVYVLGHSLGGSVAPEIARRDGKLAGLVLLAAAARPPGETVLQQLGYLAEHDKAQADGCRKLIDELTPKLAALKAGRLKPDEKVMGVPVSYWNSWTAIDPARTAAALKGLRMLIVRGERDYQVIDADLEPFRQALANRPEVTIRTYPGLNHLFMAGEGEALPAEYFRPGHVDGRVIDDIAKWIQAGK